ncbi:IclR family transcriptional regulator [Flexivirga sp. ID2601S]|uniref:IclR family transcriptional regulator n=1 Tax=Flexivirga aerilata TaxID=1656889 RepID=A0A849ACS8_9MICO|nr:IclR family transcriptional regulator [Flexivirga aerilata]
MAGNGAPGATVVSRALAVLFAFDTAHSRLSLSELADRSGLPLSTTHRLVAELVLGKALVREPDGCYVVGRTVWDLGLLAPVERGIRELARPFLSDIHAATRATVHLAVRDGLRALYLERLSGNASVPIVSTVGTRLPLHATGVGKVLLAHAPEEVRARAMRNLRRVTPYTITQPARLFEQLEAVRRDGFATTIEEMSLGGCSVAVPIMRERFDAAPEVVAAVGVVVPNLRRDRARLVTALQVAARGIGRTMPLS